MDDQHKPLKSIAPKVQRMLAGWTNPVSKEYRLWRYFRRRLAPDDLAAIDAMFFQKIEIDTMVSDAING